MDQILLQGLLWAKDLFEVFYGPETIPRTCSDQRSFQGLLFTERLSKGFLRTRNLSKVFYEPNNFPRSNMDLIPFQVLLWTEDFLEVFDESKTKSRYFIRRRSVLGLLSTEDLSKGLLSTEDLSQGPLSTEDLFKVFYSLKNFFRSSIHGRPFQGLLLTLDLLRSPTVRKPFLGLLWTRDLVTCFLLTDDLFKFFLGSSTFARSPFMGPLRKTEGVVSS